MQEFTVSLSGYWDYRKCALFKRLSIIMNFNKHFYYFKNQKNKTVYKRKRKIHRSDLVKSTVKKRGI